MIKDSYDKQAEDIGAHIRRKDIHPIDKGGGTFPTGTENQTIRHDATSWVATSILSTLTDGSMITVDNTDGTDDRLVNVIYSQVGGIRPTAGDYVDGRTILLEVALNKSKWTEVAPQLNGKNITSLVFNSGDSYFYGGTNGGQLYRWKVGDSVWTQVAPQLTTHTEIRGLTIFDSKVYGIALSNGAGSGDVLLEWNGTDAWAVKSSVIVNGGNEAFYAMIEHNTELYVGGTLDGTLYEWNGTNAFVAVSDPLASGDHLYTMASDGSYLYAATFATVTAETGNEGNLYQWDGVDTLVKVADYLDYEYGLGDGGAQSRVGIKDLVYFESEIYGVTCSGQVWKFNGSDAWVRIANTYQDVNPVAGYQTSSIITGGMIWTSAKGWDTTPREGHLIAIDDADSVWTLYIDGQAGTGFQPVYVATDDNNVYGAGLTDGKLWRADLYTMGESNAYLNYGDSWLKIVDNIDASSIDQGSLNHGYISGLEDDDHKQYLLADGTRALTGDWDIGDGRMIQADKIRARDAAGLALYEDGGVGIFIEDGGNVGIRNTDPAYDLDVKSASSSTNAEIALRTSNTVGGGTSNPILRYKDMDVTCGVLQATVGLAAANRYFGFVAYEDRDGNRLPIRFYTRDSAGSSRLAIHIASNISSGAGQPVGINTDSPAAQLSINGGVHVGGTTDPGDNNILIDGVATWRDTAIGIYSQADTYMDIFADGAVRVGNSSGGAPTTYIAIEPDADTFFVGSGSGLPFGACYGNEIAWTQANAAQDTVYLISDADMTDGNLNMVTHDGSGQLTVSKAGVYLINWCASIEISSPNKHVNMGLAIDGAVSPQGKQHAESLLANAQHTLSGSALIALTASQTVECYMLTPDTGTPDLQVDHLNITIVQIGG